MWGGPRAIGDRGCIGATTVSNVADILEPLQWNCDIHLEWYFCDGTVIFSEYHQNLIYWKKFVKIYINKMRKIKKNCKYILTVFYFSF